MSYQGIRTAFNGQHYARYRIKGEIVEVGPYDTLAQLLKENMGRTSPASTGDTQDQSCLQSKQVSNPSPQQ